MKCVRACTITVCYSPIRLEDFVFVSGKESPRRLWGSNRLVFDGASRCHYPHSLYSGE